MSFLSLIFDSLQVFLQLEFERKGKQLSASFLLLIIKCCQVNVSNRLSVDLSCI